MKLIIIVLSIIATGCANILPKEDINLSSMRTTFEEVKIKYDSVIPSETKYDRLIELGFDPYHHSNVEILTYTDMILKFMPSDNIKIKDIPEGMQQCIYVKENCFTFIAEFGETNKNRIGNATLDILGIKEETVTIGWNFKALFAIIDNVVVYKLFSGHPNTYEYYNKERPLGPLQRIGDSVIDNSLH